MAVNDVMEYIISSVERGTSRIAAMATGNATTTTANRQKRTPEEQTPTTSNTGKKGDTPVTSNMGTNPPKNTKKPKFLNMPVTNEKTCEVEKSMDEYHEEGYDSDGQLPYFGDKDWELFLMEKYTEETLTSTPRMGPVAPSQQKVPPSITETEMKK